MPDNSAMDTLKSLLGDNAEQKIQDVLNSLSQGGVEDKAGSDVSPEVKPSSNLFSSANDAKSLETVMRIKGIIDELGASNNDMRSNLLLSLKPFMRSTRQQSIDSAVRLLNLTKLTSLFKL